MSYQFTVTKEIKFLNTTIAENDFYKITITKTPEICNLSIEPKKINYPNILPKKKQTDQLPTEFGLIFQDVFLNNTNELADFIQHILDAIHSIDTLKKFLQNL